MCLLYPPRRGAQLQSPVPFPFAERLLSLSIFKIHGSKPLHVYTATKLCSGGLSSIIVDACSQRRCRQIRIANTEWRHALLAKRLRHLDHRFVVLSIFCISIFKIHGSKPLPVHIAIKLCVGGVRSIIGGACSQRQCTQIRITNTVQSGCAPRP
ncbi:unnamed protein product [Victoria cruziana]